MSNCVLIAADHPLPGVRPSQDAPFCLLSFDEVDLYCGKKYGMCLELPQWTEEGGQANPGVHPGRPAAKRQRGTLECLAPRLLGVRGSAAHSEKNGPDRRTDRRGNQGAY